MGDKYIQNTHNAPITCNARDKDKNIVFTKRFMPPVTEKWSGRILSSGYERITDEELKLLSESSRTYDEYKNKLGLLVVHDEMPEALKTPYQTISDMKKVVRQLETENAALKKQLEEVTKPGKPKEEVKKEETQFKDVAGKKEKKAEEKVS